MHQSVAQTPMQIIHASTSCQEPPGVNTARSAAHPRRRQRAHRLEGGSASEHLGDLEAVEALEALQALKASKRPSCPRNYFRSISLRIVYSLHYVFQLFVGFLLCESR